MNEPDVVIIGGGIAGLTCAVHLHRAGVSPLVVESANRPGGRARTDGIDGFLLDHSFPLLLLGAPEAQLLLDLDTLELQHFARGVVIYDGETFHTLLDPLRHPLSIPGLLGSRLGKPLDMLKLAGLRAAVAFDSTTQFATCDDTTALDALQNRWIFSERVIERVFRPVSGGFLLDPSLQISARTFGPILHSLAAGGIALPRAGLESVVEQLVRQLPSESIACGEPVGAISGNQLTLAGGRRITARRAIAVEPGSADTVQDLIGEPLPLQKASVHTLYFAAPRPPFEERLIALDGTGEQIASAVAVLTNVNRAYAPLGLALVAVSVPGHGNASAGVLRESTRAQLASWFGARVDTWEHLRTYSTTWCAPRPPEGTATAETLVEVRQGLYMCGSHLDAGTLSGAMAAGRRMAEHLLGQSF